MLGVGSALRWRNRFGGRCRKAMLGVYYTDVHGCVSVCAVPNYQSGCVFFTASAYCVPARARQWAARESTSSSNGDCLIELSSHGELNDLFVCWQLCAANEVRGCRWREDYSLCVDLHLANRLEQPEPKELCPLPCSLTLI